MECQAALRGAPERRFRALQKPGSGQSAWTVRFSTSVRGKGCHLDGGSDQGPRQELQEEKLSPKKSGEAEGHSDELPGN